jgi:predicted transcriptional regulator
VDIAQALQPRKRRYSARYQARLDEQTYTKLQELGKTYHRKRAPILRYVLQWGISHSGGWTINQSPRASVHPVHVLVEPALMQQVQGAADRHRITVAAWVRQAMRQVTLEDFPESWRAGAPFVRSHESGYYDRKFGLRLDEGTSHKLDALCQTFHRSAAEVIRQLIHGATPEDFPESWVMAANEHGAQS